MNHYESLSRRVRRLENPRDRDPVVVEQIRAERIKFYEWLVRVNDPEKESPHVDKRPRAVARRAANYAELVAELERLRQPGWVPEPDPPGPQKNYADLLREAREQHHREMREDEEFYAAEAARQIG